MGNIVAAIASSHAFALIEPNEWDKLRDRNRKGYAQRYGSEPPNHPRIFEETDVDLEVRYGRVRAALDQLRKTLETTRPDALLVIGDDQNENYTAENVPQFAIYTAEEALFFDRLTKKEQTYPCDAETARIILEGALEAGLDLSFSEGFPAKRLLSHAHAALSSARRLRTSYGTISARNESRCTLRADFPISRRGTRGALTADRSVTGPSVRNLTVELFNG